MPGDDSQPAQDDAGDDTELLDPLPALGPLDEREQVGLAEDETASPSPWLGEGESEEVGLDDAEATAAALGVEDLFGEEALTSEGKRWTLGTEAADDQVGRVELPEARDAEYGYTDEVSGSERSSHEELGSDLDLGSEAPILDDDTGALGVEEDVVSGGFEPSGDDDVTGLPPLEVDPEADESISSDLDLGRDVEVDAALSRADEDVVDSLPAPAAGADVQWLGPADDSVVDVVREGSSLYVLGSGLFRSENACSTIVTPLTGHVPTSLAYDGKRLFVTTTSGAVLAGPGFVAIPTPLERLMPLTVDAEPGSRPRLWLRTRDGRLFRSEDHGASWDRPELEGDVAAFAIDRSGGVGALLVNRGYATFARSTDGGRHWQVADAPDPGHHPREDQETFLSLTGRSVVLGHEGSGRTHVSTDAGRSFTEIPHLRGAGPLLIDELEDGPVVYGARYVDGRGVILRWRAPDRLELILDVQAERRKRGLVDRRGVEGADRIHVLRRDPTDRPGWVLVGSGFGLFRLGPGDP